MDYQEHPFDEIIDFEDQQEWLEKTDPAPETTIEPVAQDEIKDQNAFQPIIKPENDFHSLDNAYYKFKVVRCVCEVLSATAKRAAQPIARLRLEIENDDANVVINHVLFLNRNNNKELFDFFSAIGLAQNDGFIPQWDKVVGRTGGCYLVKKKLDFKTVNVIDHFVPQN